MDKDMKQTLEYQQNYKDIAAIQEPVICTLCAEILFKYFDFKARCSNTHNYLIPFVNKEDSVKLILKDIHVTKNKNNDSVPEDHDICGLCMTLIKKCFAILLDAKEKTLKQCMPEFWIDICKTKYYILQDSTLYGFECNRHNSEIEAVLEKINVLIFSEGTIVPVIPHHLHTAVSTYGGRQCKDLSIIKEPIICAPCHASLEKYSLFMTTVSIAEEKLKYMETLDINCNSEAGLSILLQSTIREKISEVNGNGRDIIKSEKILCSASENADEEVEHKYNPSVDIKLKSNTEQAFAPINILDCKIESNEIGALNIKETFYQGIEFKQELFVEGEDQKMLCNEEIEIKTDELDFSRFEESIMTQPEVIARLNGTQELPNFEDSAEVVTMYKCYSCTYQTKRKFHLKKHLLEHKNLSNVKMYKCDSCLYQATRRDKLNVHLSKHKDISEITMYKCDSCIFQTKYNRCLERHLLKHKASSQVTMYACDLCVYQTNNKKYLKSHSLKHKDISEVTMYKCDSCLYQTRYKHAFKTHLLKHKPPPETKIYLCDSCAYQTKYKRYMKGHLLKHKAPSEVLMYNCDSCVYQTINKQSLKTHLLRHKDISEVTMYECDSCVYQTIHKSSLKTHLLKHKDISEVTVYKCDSCVYQTKYKGAIKKHLLKHKFQSGVATYKCDSCSYQAKCRKAFCAHLLTHKDPSEVTIYKCNSCLYQTYNKDYLRRHVLRHINLCK